MKDVVALKRHHDHNTTRRAEGSGSQQDDETAGDENVPINMQNLDPPGERGVSDQHSHPDQALDARQQALARLGVDVVPSKPAPLTGEDDLPDVHKPVRQSRRNKSQQPRTTKPHKKAKTTANQDVGSAAGESSQPKSGTVADILEGSLHKDAIKMAGAYP